MQATCGESPAATSRWSSLSYAFGSTSGKAPACTRQPTTTCCRRPQNSRECVSFTCFFLFGFYPLHISSKEASDPGIRRVNQRVNPMRELDQPLSQLLQVAEKAAGVLSERCTQRDRSLLCSLLSGLLSARPSFERLATAFDAGEEGSEADIAIVRTMLEVRIDLETALHRINDEVLDDFALDVDAELLPFERAVLMLAWTPYEFARRFQDTFLETDAWWGILLRHAKVECDVEFALDQMRERSDIECISRGGVSIEKATRCLRLAETHLRSLRWKFVQREIDVDLLSKWDEVGRPRPRAVSDLAMRLSKASDEKLVRFEEHLRYMY